MVNGTTKNIYLLRHGKVEGKAALNGLSDVLVNADLQQQIGEALVTQDITFESIVTSPLRRCSDLANLSAQRMSLPLSVVTGFQEMNFGEVDGVPFDELEDKWEMLETFWQAPANHQLTGAESLLTSQTASFEHVVSSSRIYENRRPVLRGAFENPVTALRSNSGFGSVRIWAAAVSGRT